MMTPTNIAPTRCSPVSIPAELAPRVSVEIEGVLDRSNPVRRDVTVFNSVHLRFQLAGVTQAELVEAFDVALIVGGSIVIPHLRHAHAVLKELDGEAST